MFSGRYSPLKFFDIVVEFLIETDLGTLERAIDSGFEMLIVKLFGHSPFHFIDFFQVHEFRRVVVTLVSLERLLG